MICPHCNQCFLESEAKSVGDDVYLCPRCSAMVNSIISADSFGSSGARKGVSRTADLVKLIADVEWIIGGFLCLIYFVYMQQAGVKISTVLFSVVTCAFVVFACGMLTYALGEIVLLLTEIRNNQQMNMKK